MSVLETKCTECKGDMVSALEFECRTCLKCIPALIKNSKINHKNFLEVCEKNDKLYEEKLFFEEQLKLQLKLLKAENMGKGAYHNEVDLEQNPFEKESNEWVMWNAGWAQIERDEKLLRICAFLQWIYSSIDMCEEICRGSNLDEVAEKLKTIKDKAIIHLAEYINEDVLNKEEE